MSCFFSGQSLKLFMQLFIHLESNGEEKKNNKAINLIFSMQLFIAWKNI